MKKLINITLLILLTFVLSGCDDNEQEWCVDESGNTFMCVPEEVYTQAEVDEILKDYVLLDNLIMWQELFTDNLDSVLIENYMLIEDYDRDIDEIYDITGETLTILEFLFEYIYTLEYEQDINNMMIQILIWELDENFTYEEYRESAIEFLDD